LSFLTITLPAFCADFERGLSLGYIAPDAFQGFHRPNNAQGLPAFLRGFLELVFDKCTGSLLHASAVSTEAIYAVRQLTLVFGKILEPCSDARVSKSIRNYVDVELELAERNDHFGGARDDFVRVARMLFARAFAKVDELVYNNELIPRHGPGATADRLTGNGKFDQREWTERLEEYFPFGEYSLPNWRFAATLEDVQFHEPGAERPVRVITVPKTLKAPRIIAIEPTCMQYAQQAVAGSLIPLLESDDYIGGRRGMIGFTDQLPNQEMAREGSVRLSLTKLATLDLSDASDRVSNQHVQALTDDRFPWFQGAVQASRSRSADVPGHGVIPLSKFASMGSALCFPMEAMVFLTVAFLGIERELSGPLTLASIRSFRGSVRVYGDDIIVPARYATSVIGTLESFGFRVNHRKTFTEGNFRESCGREFYDGQDVSIVRARRRIPSSRKDVHEVVSVVSLRNQLYQAGLWSTAGWLDDRIGRVLPHYPTVEPTASLLGRVSVLPGVIQRMSPTMHAPLVKGYAVRSRAPLSGLSGEAALLKVLLNKSEQPIAERDHLERSGRPDAVYLKLGWKQPF
jgi:hypothetical protein